MPHIRARNDPRDWVTPTVSLFVFDARDLVYSLQIPLARHFSMHATRHERLQHHFITTLNG
eukprot:m.336596 g.336596  ORF g.336596 m.336596 type:complete len:61 (-) comp20539_c0_seq3:3081-3263(-)